MRALLLLLTTATVAVLSFGLQAAKPAHAATTFTVDMSDDPDLTTTPTADDCTAAANDCSLRGAINAANNNPGADAIDFDIPSSDTNCNATTDVCTILVDGTDNPNTATDLPIITEAVTINGYSQSGATENTIPLAKDGTNANLLIELNGAFIGSSNGLIQINASDVEVKGLVLKCYNTGISIQSGGSRAVIEGNFIGTDPSGTTVSCNANNGVNVFGGGANTIGGQEPAARNLISGNLVTGLGIADNGGNTIQGNLIGTKANGTDPMGNGQEGVQLFSPNNIVGGDGVDNDDAAEANLIAFNGTDGVKVNGGRNNAFAVGNRILSNSIFSNGDLGIDLDGGNPFDSNPDDGVTANDRKDRDTGPNNLQNYPVLTSATTTTIKGKLNSRPRRNFTIQFFSSSEADPSGFGEGKKFIGQITVKTNRRGNGSFTFTPAQPVLAGEFITATATIHDAADVSKLVETSEFSKARLVE